MCPPTMWIVAGLRTVRLHVDVVDGLGFTASCPQKASSAVGANDAAAPYFRPRSAIAASRLQSRPRSPLTQASSTGAGSSTVSIDFRPLGGASVNTAWERSGARPLRRL